jgi:tetratricopeptide (TPR) repeat protein
MHRLPAASLTSIFPRLMRIRFAILVCVAAVLGTATGCDEISARRKVQAANKKYKDARYEEARQLYEQALAQTPDLAIAHHNLGVTFYRLLRRGDNSADNRQIADRAAEHLLVYLRKGSPDAAERIKIRKLVTEMWVESAQVDKALAFWESENQARPKDTSVIEQLADLNYKRGDWRQAIEWLERAVAIAETDDARASAYGQIGTLCFLKLLNSKEGVQGLERIELADRGIGALQRGLGLRPKNMQMVSTLASLNQQRALASTSRVGFHVDLAFHQNHMRVFSVLREEARKAADTSAPASPGAPAEAGGGS